MNISLRTGFLIGLAMLSVAVFAAFVSYRMGMISGSVEAGISQDLYVGHVLTDLAKSMESAKPEDTLFRIRIDLDLVKQSLSRGNANLVPEQRDQINQMLTKIDETEKEIQPLLDKAAAESVRKGAAQRLRDLSNQRAKDSSRGR